MTSKPRTRQRYLVVCVRNHRHPASLETRKIYRALLDSTAAKDGLLRVIDESGEDYLYPANFFHTISLPAAVERALRRAG